MIRFDRGTSKFHRNSPLHINSNIQNSLNSKQRPYIFMFLWYIEFLFKNDITRVKCIFTQAISAHESYDIPVQSHKWVVNYFVICRITMFYQKHIHFFLFQFQSLVLILCVFHTLLKEDDI